MNWSRNGIVWGIAVVVLCLGFAAFSEASTVVFEDDFEPSTVGQALGGWRKYCRGEASQEVVDDVFRPGVHDPRRGKSVRLSDPGAGAAAYIEKRFRSSPPKTAKVIYTVYMRSEQANGQAYPIVVQDYAVRVGFDQNGKLFYATAPEKGEKGEKWVHLNAYKPYQWYEFKVVADVEAQAYDFYIDDVKKAERIPFTKPAKRISMFMIGSGGEGKGTYYVDDVKVEVEMKREPSSRAIKKEAKEKVSPGDDEIGTVVVSSFGEVISHGDVESSLRGYFPIGMYCHAGPSIYPPVPWIWEKENPQAQGSLRAAGFHSYPEVTCALSLKGQYEIWFSLRKKQGTVCGISARLSDEKKFEPVKLGREDIPEGAPRLTFFWKKWKSADLTGKEMILNHPMGFETVLNSIKFVPVGANEGDNRKTVVLRDFVNRLTPRDRIYECYNLEHIANSLEPVFTHLKQLNMNMAIVRTNDSSTTVPFQQEAVLKKADQHGLKVIMDVPYFFHFYAPLREKKGVTEAEVERAFGRFVEAVKGYRSLLGYQIADEPFVKDAQNLAVIHRVLKRLDPEHPVITVYCRGRGGEKLGSPSRDKDNMKILSEKTSGEVLLHDLYPVRHAESEFLANFDPFIRCLDDAYRQAGGRPLWLVPQAIHYSNLLRDPTAAEMRAQTYLAIAHGVQGIIYFSYSHRDNSLFTEEGKPNAACEEVGKLGAELRILAPILLKLKRIRTSVRTPDYVDLQSFVDDENRKYVIVVNKDVTAARKVKVRLPADRTKQIVNVLTGKSVAFRKAAGRIHFDLALARGDGVVLKLD